MSHERFMIRSKSDRSRYSSGGRYGGCWTTVTMGKVWRTQGHARAHLAQYSDDSRYKADAEVVAVRVMTG